VNVGNRNTDMNADSYVNNILNSIFHLSSFRKGQKEIISSVLDQQDILAVLPTGGGKSLCYQLPAVILNKLAIVICPLIALMKDQVAALQEKNIPSACLYSGQDLFEKKSIFYQISINETFILYLSPERVLKPGFQKWIQSKSISLFAIDEAHCVSQWGHDFRSDYGMLGILKKLKPEVPILALTASATPIVLQDIKKQLELKSPKKMVYGFYRPNLFYQVTECAHAESKFHLLLTALKKAPQGRVLIYCGTRKTTEELTENLLKMFNNVNFYHAGLSPQSRNQIQEDYYLGKTRILIATNAFGMGIDQPDVRLVVHYQMPANIDALYQEMGRAGRDGKDSTCLLLYSKKDKGLQSFFIQSSEVNQEIKNNRWRNLDAIVEYAEGSECRHSEILTYFKDSQRIEKCGHCDNCDPHSDRRIVYNHKHEINFKAKSKKAKANNDFILNEKQEYCFQQLKEWRKIKAKELDVPAFIIFGDQTLRNIVVKLPQNEKELLAVHGMGESKIKNFSKDILKLLSEFF
jgi:ATP-dependent DNA helicase RecQ